MNQKKFDKLYQHYIKYFGAEKEPMIFHNVVDTPESLHIDVVHLAPTEDRPFQVLATIGTSDHAMRPKPHSLSDRNEYITLLPADWDVNDEKYRWVLVLLQEVAQYPHEANTMLTYSHTLDFTIPMKELQSDDFNMCGAGLLFPQVCENTNILRCKTGLFENVTILHMMPLTRTEMDEIIARREKGQPDWSDMFYPEDDAAYGKLPFLCACKR
ncbi:MAG: suppressor of fused domain protein [Clostridia bacterium]|nr:suppressor of fused domain protein [Clostridia bacterium]